MNILKYLKIILFIEIIVLIFNVVFALRDYRDLWSLDGVAVTFFLMIFTYSIYFVKENDVRWILFFGLITRAMWGFIPVFKYIWFPGHAIDQHSHYRLSLDIFNLFYIPEGRPYSNTPLAHILTSMYSSILDIPLYNSFKIMPILFWFSYPLLIYLFVHKFNLTNDTKINKYILWLSFIPFKAVQSYIFVGRLFGTMVSLFVMYQIFKTSEHHERRDLFLTIFFFIILIGNHMMSSLFFMSFLFALFIVYGISHNIKRIKKVLPKVLPSTTFFFLIIIINISWLFYYGPYLSGKITELILGYAIRMFSSVEFGGTTIPTRAFQISILDLGRIILLSEAVNIMILGLSFLAMLIILWNSKKYNKYNHFLNVFLIVIYMYIIIGFGLNIGEGWLNRMVSYIVALFPLLSIPLLTFFKKRFDRLNVIMIIGILIFSIVGFYSPQEIVPRANAYSPDLPSDDYLLQIGSVNTIYQREMIFWARDNLPNTSRIASDELTRHQIISLTDINYSYPRLAWFYPFETLLGGNVTERFYTHFLSHQHGKSGLFIEKAEIRTKNLISEAMIKSSIVYYNGFSFILTEPFMFNTTGD